MSPYYPRMVLGLGADGASFPASANGSASAGEAVVGPMQLLAFLEVALGLGGRTPSVAKRIASWRVKLAAAGVGRFWARSFEADPFATTRLLLDWRDGLVAAGWTPARLVAPPKRLADIAAAELAGGMLPPGYADRLCAVIAAVVGRPTMIGRVDLIEPRALLPRGLSRLVAAIEANGTTVTELSAPAVQASGDLGLIQAMMRDGGQPNLAGDGSFAFLSATSEIGAAEALADWLAVAPEAHGAVLIADRETLALDAALQARGLPPVGRSAKSPQRGILQVLPLVLAVRWAPFDARRMLEFLQLPRTPLPSAVRRRLIDALQEAPGRGGVKWRDAIDRGLEEDDARPAESPEVAQKRSVRAREQIAALLEAPLLGGNSGMPLADLRALCGLVSTWAGERVGSDPLAIQLAGAATALADAAITTGLDPIPRLDLERLLEQVMEEGLPDPGRIAAAAPWSVVHDPAGLWDLSETIVWWGVSPPARPARSPWTTEEALRLKEAGCPPDSLLTALEASTRAWRQVICQARKKVLLVAPPAPGAGIEADHPLLQELEPVLAAAPAACRPVAEVLLAQEDGSILGTPLRRTSLPSLALPTSRKTWHITLSSPYRRERESASSLGQLLGCPYAWIAQYALRLRTGRQASVPQSEQMIGTLAHALIERLFKPGAPPAAPDAQAEAGNLLDDMIAEMAAPLHAPGQAAELSRVRKNLPQAAQALAELLSQNGLTITAVEAEHSAADMPNPGAQFGGQIDMQLTDAQGRPVVLDFKWSRSDRYRRKEMERGSAVQLAAYSKMIDAGEAAGYFMLAQRRVIGRLGAIAGGTIEAAPSLADTWQRAVHSVEQRHAAINSGQLHAIGVDYDRLKPGPDPDGITIETSPPCGFCDFGHLCGKELAR